MGGSGWGAAYWSAVDSQWWWMSFCGAERPAGQQFLGVAIIDAPTFEDALTKSWLTGVNPGGEILAGPIPAAHVPPLAYRNRLLDRVAADEAARY
jgi:hypothetical protein